MPYSNRNIRDSNISLFFWYHIAEFSGHCRHTRQTIKSTAKSDQIMKIKYLSVFIKRLKFFMIIYENEYLPYITTEAMFKVYRCRILFYFAYTSFIHLKYYKIKQNKIKTYFRFISSGIAFPNAMFKLSKTTLP